PRIILGRLHLVAPAVRVNAHARTARTAEQIVDRLSRDFAGDVPQRLLDPGGGTIELERAAALRIVVEGDLQDVADVERIAADQITAQLLDLRGNRAVAIVLAVGLAPSDRAGIGLDPHEHEILAPARVNGKALDARYFHLRTSSAKQLRRHPEEAVRI